MAELCPPCGLRMQRDQAGALPPARGLAHEVLEDEHRVPRHVRTDGVGIAPHSHVAPHCIGSNHPPISNHPHGVAYVRRYNRFVRLSSVPSMGGNPSLADFPAIPGDALLLDKSKSSPGTLRLGRSASVQERSTTAPMAAPKSKHLSLRFAPTPTRPQRYVYREGWHWSFCVCSVSVCQLRVPAAQTMRLTAHCECSVWRLCHGRTLHGVH